MVKKRNIVAEAWSAAIRTKISFSKYRRRQKFRIGKYM